MSNQSAISSTYVNPGYKDFIPPYQFNEEQENVNKERKYSPHSEEQMKKRGVSKESVEEAISKGIPKPGNIGDRTAYDLPSGESSTGRGVRVVIENGTGEVVTVIDKGSNYIVRGR